MDSAEMKRSELEDVDYSMPQYLSFVCHHCLSQLVPWLIF